MVDVEVSWPVIGVRQTAMDSGAGEVRLQDRVWLRSRLARTRGGDGVDGEDSSVGNLRTANSRVFLTTDRPF